MIKKIFVITSLILSFAIGGYVWKLRNTGRFEIDESMEDEPADVGNADIGLAAALYVGDTPITPTDIEWEYQLLTRGIVNNPEMTAIPELGDKVEEVLSPLKERLVANLIERKLLFQFIKEDRNFTIDDPTRYTKCLEDWQKVIKDNADFFKDGDSREKLKNRLCEQAILAQYLDEIIYKAITISPDELREYYNKHIKEYSKGDRVVIRQIVLASEKEAKKVISQVRDNNFAEMAKKYSISEESQNGGLLGPFAKGDMPHVFNVAFSMRTGDIQGVIKSNYGFHIIRLEKKIKKTIYKMDEVEDEMKKKIMATKKEAAYQTWVESALNAIAVKTAKSAW
ncbi:MAG: peptidyl-prolyl cis-trans isomerase [Oligoflexales bacterium]